MLRLHPYTTNLTSMQSPWNTDKITPSIGKPVPSLCLCVLNECRRQTPLTNNCKPCNQNVDQLQSRGTLAAATPSNATFRGVLCRTYRSYHHFVMISESVHQRIHHSSSRS